jgi:hypothetical protein
MLMKRSFAVSFVKRSLEVSQWLKSLFEVQKYPPNDQKVSLKFRTIHRIADTCSRFARMGGKEPRVRHEIPLTWQRVAWRTCGMGESDTLRLDLNL